MCAIEQIERVERVDFGPLGISVDREGTGNDTHAALGNRLLRRVVIIDGRPIDVVGINPGAARAIEVTNGCARQLTTLFNRKTFPDNFTLGHVFKYDARGVIVEVRSHDHQLSFNRGTALPRLRGYTPRKHERFVSSGKRNVDLEWVNREERPGPSTLHVLQVDYQMNSLMLDSGRVVQHHRDDDLLPRVKRMSK